MDIKQLIDAKGAEVEQLLAVVAVMASRGEAPATGGNYSLKLDDQHILISRSGANKEALCAADLLLINFHQEILATAQSRDIDLQSGLKTSAETPLHLQVMAQTSAKCVLHSHGLDGLLFANQFLSTDDFHTDGVFEGMEMMKAFEGVTTHECKVYLPIFQNSQDMEFLSSKVKEHLIALEHSQKIYAPGFLLKGHGLYAWGDSVEQAKRHLDAFNYLFEYYYRLSLVKSYKE